MKTLPSLPPSEPLSQLAVGNRLLAASFRLSVSRHSSFAYTARLADSPADIRRAQALRFAVFNLELGEGLPESHVTRLDADEFDWVCDHLIVEDQTRGELVGTYRLQSGPQAAARLGFYCAREFDLAPFVDLQAGMVELGRACVARAHRHLVVLQLLWRAIAFYARTHHARYLIGCSSVHAQDPRVGASLYSSLYRTHLAPAERRTQPLPELACPLDELADETPAMPKLLAAYLALGAKICGPPAIDRNFKTIDFLTLLDLKAVPQRSFEKYVQRPGAEKSQNVAGV